MTAPDAMRSLFEGDVAAPTRVTVLRAVAERELGVSELDAEQFAAWIDREGDRIFASALRKRDGSDGLEDVTLDVGDMLPPGGTDFGQDARVIAIGEAVQGVDPLFLGTLKAALDFALARGAPYREQVAIWTETSVYASRDFAALAAEHDMIDSDGG